MKENDKYPDESGRRRFVKGVVGSSALAGIGTASAAMVETATSPTGEGGGTTSFFGIENTDGPAPRGMPQIPIKIDSQGNIKGVYPEVKTEQKRGQSVKTAKTTIGGVPYSVEWFQYCGVQTYKGIQPSADQDNFFRYAESGGYQWQSSEVSSGDKVHVDDFSDYKTWGNGIGKSGLGKPAIVSWRSQDTETTIPVQILRIPPDIFKRMKRNSDSSKWIEASTQENFIAWLDKCTHFCCVPGFKSSEQSAKFGAENEVYCPCHQSVYDPFSIIEETFVALPRPEKE